MPNEITNERIHERIMQGAHSAFIGPQQPDDSFDPKLIFNRYGEGSEESSLRQLILDELKHCKWFNLSVAFIRKSGITDLLGALNELKENNIRGKILTSDYLTFSEPDALDKLDSLENIDLRMYRTSEKQGFHTKGYIFGQEGCYHLIVGSSNLTENALVTNHEWNILLFSTHSGSIAQAIKNQFDLLWEDDHTFPYSAVKDEYRREFNQNKEFRKSIQLHQSPSDKSAKTLVPNSMQQQFVTNIGKIAKTSNRALLISATGTGKTYASAFAAKSLHPNRLLFIVHREQIAHHALVSYQRVLGGSPTDYGILSGTKNESGKKFLFATLQTISRETTLKTFKPDDFDLIVIDESHHAAAKSYTRVIDYFKPKMLLGMTGTPDRNDGYDLYNLFDHNIAYEIRLQDALRQNLLCPFNYFGIADIEVEGLDKNNQEIDDDKIFNLLTAEERAKKIIERSKYYGFSGDRLKCLVFCSRNREAVKLASLFRQLGERAVALSGADSQDERELQIAKLVASKDSDLYEDRINYIFTVDIFNEGIDIPEVNQVILLRPTKSAIVFTQQLGRGLRKAEGKEFVVVIDFISNYSQNYLIPIALSGDRSYNKDNLRRHVSRGTSVIAGQSTIYFDQISRKRIFQSIDKANTQEHRLLLDCYTNLKNKLGRIPKMSDFDIYGEIEISNYIEKYSSYYNFLKKYEDSYKVRFSPAQENIIQFISLKLTNGKRLHELLILQLLTEKASLGKRHLTFEEFKNIALSSHKIKCDEADWLSSLAILKNKFGQEKEIKKFSFSTLIKELPDESVALNGAFLKMLTGNIEFLEHIHELINLGIDRHDKLYPSKYQDTNLVLGAKYSYEDVCRLLNWPKNANAQNIGGYFYEKKTKTLPVFINYNKDDDAIKYEDRFIDQSTLIALSKHPRKITSSDADHIYKRTPEDKDNHIYLFVRKNKDDKIAKEFYFLGEMHTQGEPQQVTIMGSNDLAFEINYRLDNPVKPELFDFITSD